jgi:hypothetical protein
MFKSCIVTILLLSIISVNTAMAELVVYIDEAAFLACVYFSIPTEFRYLSKGDKPESLGIIQIAQKSFEKLT